jgi:serine/threonine-protein kinase
MESHDDTVGWQPQAAATPTLEVGSRINGYVVNRILGTGAFGVVAEATDVVTQRVVAIKALKPIGPEAATRARLIAEARRAAALEHDNIVRIYHVIAGDDGSAFIVMQFVDGPTLADLIRTEGPLSYSAAVKITLDVARALTYAHEQGFVHLDIKPSNILIDKNGRALVADFGVAVHHDERHAALLGGTPIYMAPEQIQGEQAHVDGRTDLWALGVVLYEMLTGRLPFSVSEPARGQGALVQEICSVEPKPASQWNPRVPEPIEEVCLRCLAKRPQDRFRSATGLIQALRDADKRVQDSIHRLGPASHYWLADERFEDDPHLSKRELIARGCFIVAAILVGMMLLMLGIVAPRRLIKLLR